MIQRLSRKENIEITFNSRLQKKAQTWVQSFENILYLFELGALLGQCLFQAETVGWWKRREEEMQLFIRSVDGVGYVFARQFQIQVDLDQTSGTSGVPEGI